MAKASKFDKAIKELMKDYKKATMKAVEYASNKAVEDIFRYAHTCLEEYYESYDPNIYNRTDTLGNAFLPYLKITDNGNQIVSVAGVEYSPTVLDMFIQDEIYRGSKKYGHADAEWVIDNYLRGVHPATNGGTTTETTLYYEVVDPVSPTEKMNKYLNDYRDNFQSHYYDSLIQQMAKHL